MKVLRQTAQQLTLREVPWIFWLMGTIFTAVGVGVGLTLGGETTLMCDRTLPAAQCTLTSANLIDHTSLTLPVDRLQGAEVETSRDSDGGYTYRVVLLTQEGPVPMSQVYSSGLDDYSGQAAQINQFLQNAAQPKLHLQQDHRWWGLLFLGAFGGTGLAMLLGLGKVVTCDFDKTLGQLVVTRRGLLGGPHQRQYALRQVVGAQVERSSGSDGDTYRTALLLESGERVPLTSYYSSGRGKEEQTVACIREFLGVTDEAEADSSTVSEAGATVAQVSNLIGLVVGGKNKRQETIADCQNQLNQDPYNADSYYTLALALIMQGDKFQAKQVLETGRVRCMQHGDAASATRLDQAIQDFGLAA